MRMCLTGFLVLLSFLGCSKAPEVIDGSLTRDILQRHLVDRGPIRYSDDDYYWKCEEVKSITQQTSTRATVEVLESGFKSKYGKKVLWSPYRTRIQYGETSRDSTYQLSRKSLDDFWRVDHCNWILKLKTGKYGDSIEPEKLTKNAGPVRPTELQQATEPQNEFSPAETKQASEMEIEKFRADLASIEREIESRQDLLFPDTVILVNGREMKCEIVDETDDSFRIKTSVGIATLSRDRISSFTHATEAEREEALQARLRIDELETKRLDLSSRIDELQETFQPERDEVKYIEARHMKAKTAPGPGTIEADSRDGDWPNIEVKSVFEPTNAQDFIAILEIDNRRRFVKEGDSFDSYTVLRVDGITKCVAIIKSDSLEEKEFCAVK